MKRRTFLTAGTIGLGALASPSVAAAAGSRTSLSPKLLAKVKRALLTHDDAITHKDIIGVADYSLHSAKPRFHLVDLKNGRTTSLLVAHGKGSDKKHTGWLQEFSNIPGSEASSGGSYLTSETYTGKHGLSRRLDGLEARNDNARSRAIVIHGAWYVNPDMVSNHGKVGRSQGCFAFSESDLKTVLERLGSGRLLYAYKG